MRTLAPLVILVLALAGGCGDDGGGLPDADVAFDDAAPDAPFVDASPPDAASTVGQLCVTQAVDGGPGSCASGEVCCTAGGTTVCAYADDCMGTHFVACDSSTDCQGGVCCKVDTMQFCTKQNACDDYGGTILP